MVSDDPQGYSLPQRTSNVVNWHLLSLHRLF